MSSLSAEFVLRASERCLAPSGPMPLLVSLRVMVKSECQRLLTLRITRVAAHLSDLVAAFDVIRLAMTVAERTVSLLPERSINSMGSSPRSCLIERA